MSHPTQTLRDKVWGVLNNVWVGDSEEDLYIKTDAILDLVREALLSDEALEKGAIAMLGATFEFPGAGERIWTEINVDDNPYGTRFDTGSPDKVLSEARATITAALDAVTGEGGER